MKFIHLADVHLGAVPDKGYPWSQAREEEIWETFRRVIAGIRENPVDLLFIAGDLFHRQPLLRELKEVDYLFSTIPDTRVYLTAGNHDYIGKGSFYEHFSWSENVFFMKEEELTCVRDPKLDVYVYGLSYHRQEIREPLYQGACPGKEEGLHILLAHGGDEQHIPLNPRALLTAGFDYIALGHIHRPQILVKDAAAYAGSPEPLDRNEIGPHGYIEGEFANGRLQIRFVPAACRVYQQIVVNLKEGSTQNALEDALKKELARRGSQHIYRILLKGSRSPEMFFLPERLKALGNVIEVLDQSHPAYDLEELRCRYAGTLVGDYIDSFMEKQALTEVEEKALYYGLQALLETSR